MIVRIAKRDQPFAQIDKRTLSDKTLSLEAKGLAAYLLSKPDDWQVRFDDMLGQALGNVHAVRRALRELRARGYAHLTHPRRSGKACGSEWIVHERPALRYTNPESQKTCTYTNNDKRTDNDSRFSKTDQCFAKEYESIIERFNERCAAKGARIVNKRTTKLENALRVALSNAGGVKPLYDLFNAVAEGRVNPLQNNFTLTSLLWDYVKGKVKVVPKRMPSLDAQRESRREKEAA